MSGRKVTGLPLPETPREAPPEIHGLVNAIEDHLGDSQVMEAVLALGRCFEYLTRYFSAVAGGATQILELGHESQVAVDFEVARSLLKDRLELLGDKPTDAASKLVRSVFYVGATRKTPTPRRHSRLLDLGGIPIRGYLNLGEWIALTPGEKDLATESKANRELLRYLPILKEWITATASFFLDASQSELRWAGENAIVFDLLFSEGTQEIGPMELTPELAKALGPYIKESGSLAEDEVPQEAETKSIEFRVEPEEAPEPKPELVAPQADEATPDIVLSEPPRIEVVGIDSEEELDVPQQEQTSPPGEPLETSIEEEIADAPEALEPEIEPEPEEEAASLPGDGQEQVTELEAAVDSPPLASFELSMEPDSLEESPPKTPNIAVAKSPPLPPQPDEAALADPVIAALNVASKKERAKPPEPPALQLYPLVTGPPPEFFDEIVVEVDYPEVLNVALTDLNGAIESNDSILICGQMQRCFDILIQFFAGLAGAVITELDEEALFDFEVEDGRFDLGVKVDLIVTALSSLEEHWETNDAANLLWSVFYDTLLPATDPNCAYLHTRLLGVEGLVPEPFIEFLELCEQVPGVGKLNSQAQCRKVCHHYLPILAFWLENAMPLFLECEVDFVDEDKGKALSWAATVAGAFLDGTGSGFWLEIASDRWNLPRPELAPVFVGGDAPDVILPVFEELNTALERGEFDRAGLYARVALDFLIQYFAGCAASLWRQQGEMTEQALALFYPDASLAERERLLVLSLGGISTESEVGSNLSKLFSKGSLQYRALTQRAQGSEMAALSTWAASREKVGEAELLTYLPLLRSWIGAANPWFAAGEQLFEDPTRDGVLEGVVAYGDEFLEMVDPEYVIQLTRECLELVAPFGEEEEADDLEDEEAAVVVAADTPFTGKLPQLPILAEGPPVLVGHVSRLLESAQDRRTSNAWLGSAFEYLIQYFAGLCTTVLGGSAAPLSRNVLPYFNPNASLREREILLLACVEHLKTAATGSVQENVRNIFLKPDGSYREHTKYLGALGAGSLDENEMLLSYWCRIRHQAGHLTTEDLHFGTRVLNTWLDASKPFFASCEHYAEDPGADGQEEMVVELADDYLDMVLPDYAIQLPARGYYELLYKESNAEAQSDMESFFPEHVRPTLLGPQEVVLGGVAGDSEEELLGAADEMGAEDIFGGAAENYNAEDLFSGSAVPQQLDVDDMFTGAAPDPMGGEAKDSVTDDLFSKATAQTEGASASAAASAAALKKKKKKKSKKQELGSAVLELYKKERLEKARKRAEARARKAESEPTQLSFTLQYRGLKNSKQLGGRGHFGLLELKNVGGGELRGTIEPDHPCVKVQPNRFEGNQVRVVYQIDPADMPSTGRTGLTINTQDERISLRLDRLVPTSWWRERTQVQALALLGAPSALYGFWLLLLLAVFLGPSVEEAFRFYGQSTDLEKIPWSTHLRAWMFAVLAILPGASGIPAAIKSMFARFDYSVQEETRWMLIPFMMLPTLVMISLMYGTNFWVFDVPPGRLPLLGSRLLISVLTFGLNLLAASLFSLQTTVWWEDRSDTQVAKRTFIGFWVATVLLGVVVTFFMW